MAFETFPAGTMLAPTPVVMVSCQAEGQRPNIITIAWAGVINSDPPMLSISVRPGRHSYQLIEQSGEFVVNLVGRRLLKACDYCGVRSGRDEDKFVSTGLTALPLPELAHAPAIAEAPVAIPCRVKQRIELGTHVMYLADILSVKVDSALMDDKGALDLKKADLVAYSHGDYQALSDRLGFFGFSVARPDVLARRMGQTPPVQKPARRRPAGRRER